MKKTNTEYNKAYYSKNKERLNELGAKHRRDNPEYYLEKARDQYKENPELFKLRGKEWRKNNPEKYAEQRKLAIERHKTRYQQDAAYREAYNEKGRKRYHRLKETRREVLLVRAAKARASKYGREFSLKPEDITVPLFCPILGIELRYNNEKASSDSPSLDRLNNTKGYTKDNVHIISRKANAMKLDASKEELIAFANWVLANEDKL